MYPIRIIFFPGSEDPAIYDKRLTQEVVNGKGNMEYPCTKISTSGSSVTSADVTFSNGEMLTFRDVPFCVLYSKTEL